MLIVDAHEDLAWNMLTFGRDYRFAATETRKREAGSEIPLHNGDTLLGWPDYQRGQVALIFATLFASPARRKLGGWDILCYETTEEANAIYRAQVQAYHRLVGDHPDFFRLVQTRTDLKAILDHWKNSADPHPVGLVLLMEGAEAVQSPAELAAWWESGIRIVGPAWAGTRFCGGTREPGPLTQEGYALLAGMAEHNFILDLSHMDEKAALQALDTYPKRIIASHANALTLLKGTQSNRHLTDRLITGLLERDGLIGIVPANGFLRPDWKESGGRECVSLSYVVAQIDYICQMAGNAAHVGLGSDFDGGWGLQSIPGDIDTIADLQKLVPLLREKGFTAQEIAGILGETWLSLLNQTLPESL
jgi:membrane dipeptidase